MVGVILALLLLFCRGVWAQSGGGGKFATSLCAELITPNDYTCIEHQVVTDDGFILGIQNMPCPHGQKEPSVGPAILLQHGLIAAGDNWVLNSPQESLAFILADAGYDVWIANNRAVQWSHGHQYLNSYEDAYWAWTYDELASYDLKAATEFVYNQVGRKLTYIGHSQGTLMLLAGLTGGKFKDQVLGYLNAAVLLCPVTSVAHLYAPLTKLIFQLYGDELLEILGYHEFDANILVNLTCTSPLTSPLLCGAVYLGALGLDNIFNIDQSRIQSYAQYFPQPTSSYNFNHIAQSFRTNLFQFYDKGPSGNLAAYGTSTPPIYNLTTFPTSLPLQLWTGGIDGLADPQDTAHLLGELPSNATVRQINNIPFYGHADFVIGTNSHLEVYPGIIEFLEVYA